jgi:GWxTD domain-containing protein
VEVYSTGTDSDAAFILEMNLIDSTKTVIWEEKKILSGFGKFCSCACEVGVKLTELGEYRLRTFLLNSDGVEIASREKPFFISSSMLWIEDHFETAMEYVRYIASSSEMKAMRSAPPEEQMKLWKEFWEKRDPFPSTPVNESLMEYFRRLKYVNKNFTTHIEEGWRTDRGRVYLTLGPPDESIRRQRWSNLGTWEIWVYDRSLGFKAVLYFEDRGFTEDYHLINQGTFIRAKSRIR